MSLLGNFVHESRGAKKRQKLKLFRGNKISSYIHNIVHYMCLCVCVLMHCMCTCVYECVCVSECVCVCVYIILTVCVCVCVCVRVCVICDVCVCDSGNMVTRYMWLSKAY